MISIDNMDYSDRELKIMEINALEMICNVLKEMLKKIEVDAKELFIE